MLIVHIAHSFLGHHPVLHFNLAISAIKHPASKNEYFAHRIAGCQVANILPLRPRYSIGHRRRQRDAFSECRRATFGTIVQKDPRPHQ